MLVSLGRADIPPHDPEVCRSSGAGSGRTLVLAEYGRPVPPPTYFGRVSAALKVAGAMVGQCCAVGTPSLALVPDDVLIAVLEVCSRARAMGTSRSAMWSGPTRVLLQKRIPGRSSKGVQEVLEVP